MISPRKILVVRLSSIGDIVLASPVIRALRLRFPDARIDFLVKSQFASLLENNPDISNIIPFDPGNGFSGLLQFRKQLTAEKYDWYVDLHRSLRSRFIGFSGAFRLKTTYSKQLFNRFMLIKLKKNFYKETKPVYLRYFEALKPFQIEYDGKGTEVFLTENDFTGFDAQIFTNKTAVLCPGAAHENKQWFPERFAQLAARLVNSGFQVVLLGGKKEKLLCRNIKELAGVDIRIFAGETTLRQSAALLSKATVVVANDSGMMHLAQAVKTPVVAIYGPTTRELGFFPIPEKSLVVEKQLSCRPCTFKGAETCPRSHFNCMMEIEVEDVADAVLKLLS